ncbi:MAG: hypothetical protein U0176_19215 [Bacteroidia bacterium]
MKIKVMGLLLVLLTLGYVQAQSIAPAEPVRQGGLADPSVDAAGYDAHKAQWVAEHPDEYNKMVEQGTKSTLPWNTPEEKEKWAAEHPAEYKKMTEQGADNRTRMTREQFNSLSPAYQERVRLDANIVVEE